MSTHTYYAPRDGVLLINPKIAFTMYVNVLLNDPGWTAQDRQFPILLDERKDNENLAVERGAVDSIAHGRKPRCDYTP